MPKPLTGCPCLGQLVYNFYKRVVHLKDKHSIKSLHFLFTLKTSLLCFQWCHALINAVSGLLIEYIKPLKNVCISSGTLIRYNDRQDFKPLIETEIPQVCM